MGTSFWCVQMLPLCLLSVKVPCKKKQEKPLGDCKNEDCVVHCFGLPVLEECCNFPHSNMLRRRLIQNMPTTTKREIVRSIAERLNLTQVQTKDIVQNVFDSIAETLVTEGRIELRNFGVFMVKKRKARKARNI